MVYLLDTNILSDLIRNPSGRSASRVDEIAASSIVTSIVAVAELRFGLVKRGSHRLTEQAEKVLATIEVLALGDPVDRVYADIRSKLERVGRPIGANDFLIAAHALSLDATLVTDNMREFSRVPSLRIENWLR